MTNSHKTGDYISNKGVYVQLNVDNAIIVAPKDISERCDWYDGKKACEDMFYRMPTLKELQIIHDNKDIINKALVDNGGEALKEDDCYWSSTEFSNYNSWILNMINGNNNGGNKDYNGYVRAVVAL